MFAAQRSSNASGAYLGVALFWLISVLGLPATRAADPPGKIAEPEEDLKKAQKERDDIRQQIDKVLAEERKLAPAPKTWKAQLAERTLKRETADRQLQSTLKFIEEQRTAAIRAELGDNPPEEQLNKWEQTAKGRSFVERRDKATKIHRASVTRIRQEFQTHLSPERRKLLQQRKALEEKHARAVAKVQQKERQLVLERGDLSIRAQTDQYRVKPGETVTLTFFVDGGKPPYSADTTARFISARDGEGPPLPPLTPRFEGVSQFNLQVKAPNEPGIISGDVMVKDKGPAEGGEDYLVVVGEATDGSLRLFCPQRSFSGIADYPGFGVKASWDVEFWVLGGTPPYQVEGVPDDPVVVCLFPDDAIGTRTARVNVYAAGRYSVELRVTDARGAEDKAILRFECSIEGEGESSEKPPENKPEKPPTRSTNTPPTKPASKPSTGNTKPTNPTMPTGRFHAKLWDAASGPGWVRSSDFSYTPLVISIDPNGAISGKANYNLSLDHFNPGWAQRRTAYSQNLRFALDGFSDPKSGKTTLKITEGRRELHHVQKGNNRRIEQIMEFNTTLQGWRVPSPRDEDLLANVYIGGMGRTGQAQKQKDFPNIGVGQDGKPAFLQKGFFNHMGIDPQFEPGTYHLTKDVNYWQNESEAGSIDDLKSTGPTKTPVGAWFLEILGPADDDDSSDRELLMLAIWPRSPVRLTGDTVQLAANAVYSDKVFEAVDVTDKATWRQTPGLRPAKGTKGCFELTKAAYDEQGRPRSQYVRAGVRKGIDWTADTVQVVPPATSQVRTGEQPESPE